MQRIFHKKNRLLLVLYLLAFCFFVAILPKEAFREDMNYWTDWMQWIGDHGFGNIYAQPVEYHPLFLYWLWFFQWFMGTMEEVRAHLNYIKVFPLLFDFIGALSILYVVQKRPDRIIFPFLLLFNIAYMYNTMLWGQVDSVHTAFLALSLLFGLRNRPLVASLFLLLALNTKLQAIIYLPVWGLLLLPHFLRSYTVTLKTVGILFICQLLIFLPFIWGDSISGFWQVIVGADGRHPHVSMNAYNMWYFFIDTNPAKIVDTTIFVWGISFKTWGRALFFLFSAVALFPLLKTSYQHFKHRLTLGDDYMEKVFLTAGLITIIFFYFNTQMHERYSHSAILLFFFYAVRSGRYFLYILCSLAYFLNMEDVLRVFQFENYGIVPFDPRFIAALYLILMLWSIYRLYHIDRRETGIEKKKRLT